MQRTSLKGRDRPVCEFPSIFPSYTIVGTQFVWDSAGPGIIGCTNRARIIVSCTHLWLVRNPAVVVLRSRSQRIAESHSNRHRKLRHTTYGCDPRAGSSGTKRTQLAAKICPLNLDRLDLRQWFTVSWSGIRLNMQPWTLFPKHSSSPCWHWKVTFWSAVEKLWKRAPLLDQSSYQPIMSYARFPERHKSDFEVLLEVVVVGSQLVVDEFNRVWTQRLVVNVHFDLVFGDICITSLGEATLFYLHSLRRRSWRTQTPRKPTTSCRTRVNTLSVFKRSARLESVTPTEANDFQSRLRHSRELINENQDFSFEFARPNKKKIEGDSKQVCLVSVQHGCATREMKKMR